MKETGYMDPQRHRKIIISGGGTGGHIFPAISIANAVREKDHSAEILFVGAEGKLEMEKVPAAGYRIIGLPVSGIKRKSLSGNFSVFLRLMRSLRKSKKILKEFKPDVVVGVGGYASGPLLRQAGKMKIPMLIQEQNSYAGITNRLLARKASVICVAYDGMEKYFPAGRIVKTGNPVRQDFENLERLKPEALSLFGLSAGLPVVLILGGSLGAGSINSCLLENIGLMKVSECQWLWQTGKLYYEKISESLSGSDTRKISVHGFIDRMDMAFAAADIIVSRAGAGTISELCLVGKPVILIPSPNVAEDHQTKNAMALAGRNAALVIPDKEISELLVPEALKLVADRERRESFARNISAMAERNADRRIAEMIIKLAGK